MFCHFSAFSVEGFISICYRTAHAFLLAIAFPGCLAADSRAMCRSVAVVGVDRSPFLLVRSCALLGPGGHHATNARYIAAL